MLQLLKILEGSLQLLDLGVYHYRIYEDYYNMDTCWACKVKEWLFAELYGLR